MHVILNCFILWGKVYYPRENVQRTYLQGVGKKCPRFMVYLRDLHGKSLNRYLTYYLYYDVYPMHFPFGEGNRSLRVPSNNIII